VRFTRSDILWRSSHDAVRDERRTADAVYGVIVGAGVMAAAHLPTSGRLALAVVGTLVVYWAAERYAAVMAKRTAAGHHLLRSELRHELADGWELVTASFLPIVVLLTVDGLGAELDTAVIAALVTSTALLFLAGLRIGAQGQLSFWERVTSAAVAGVFGVVLIALKVALH
jgi:hypothetical protein